MKTFKILTFSILSILFSGHIFAQYGGGAGDGYNAAVSSTLDLSAVSNDINNPTAAITSTASDPTNTMPIPVTITFAEEIFGNLELSHFTVTNGTISNLTIESSTVWKANLNPAGDGDVSIKLNADKVRDAAGNKNDASSTFNIVFNGSPLGVTLTSDSSGIVTGKIPITVEFTKVVENFDPENEITAYNGTVSDVFETVKDRKWTANVTPKKEGVMTVKVNASVAQDAGAVFNKNTASNILTFKYDVTPPSVFIHADDYTLQNQPITIYIEFSELVSGFDIDDLTAAYGSFSNLQVLDSAKKWSVEFTTPQTIDTIKIADKAVRDTAYLQSSSNYLALPRANVDIEKINQEDYQIYPNPSNGIFKINSDNTLQNAEIKIFTLSGQCVYNQLLKNPYENTIKIKNAQKGIYTLQIIKNNTQLYKKIMIK